MNICRAPSRHSRLTARRHAVVVVTTALVVLASLGVGTPHPADAAPADRLTSGRQAARILAVASAVGADVGVWGRDLRTGRVVAVHADRRFPVLSMFKVYAASAILDAARRGLLRLDERVPVRRADIVDNAPITSTRVGSTMSWTEVARAALQYSDNTAGNLMLHRIGGPAGLTAYARSVGDPATLLVRRETALNDATPGDVRDTTTPVAFAAGLRALMVDRRLASADRSTLLGWMRGSTTSTERFRKRLPPGWTTADKTGSGAYGTTNDGGVLYGPRGERILLVVQTRSARADRYASSFGDLVADIAAVFARG